MKRLALLLCALLCLALPARAWEEWTAEEWARVQADLFSSEPSPVPAERRIDPAPPPVPGEDGALTVLLLSSDAPDVGDRWGRTDLLLLCRVEFATGDIRLLVLPEESMVRLPGLPEDVMLRHAACFGGPLLTLGTVNEALGMKVGRYCMVNLDSFRQIVDLMGGVELILTEGEALALEKEPGENLLTGAEALRYARLRQQGDGSPRAQKLLEAVFTALTGDGSLEGVYQLLDAALALVDTNLTTKDLLHIVWSVAARETPGHFAAAALEDLSPEKCREFLYGETD